MTDGISVTLKNVRDAAQIALAEFKGGRLATLPENLEAYLTAEAASETTFRIPVLHARAGARVALVHPLVRGFIVIRLDRPAAEGAKVEAIRTESVPPSPSGAG